MRGKPVNRDERTGGILLIALLLWTAGCASLGAAHGTSTHAARAMADETARLYHVPQIEVVVAPLLPGVGGSYERGLITVSPQVATSRFRDWVLAHELAHYLLGHEAPLRGTTPAELERELVRRELDANAKAVEVLARVRGLSEAEALRMVYAHLLSAHRAVEAGRVVVPWGHLRPCAEIAELLTRFPAQSAWTGRLECARGV